MVDPTDTSEVAPTPQAAMIRLDALFSHVWMVRTFLKHSDEAAEDEELAGVHRDLYDVMLALGQPINDNNPAEYLKKARKKAGKLRRANDLFAEIQPEISDHTNFRMAVRSLQTSVADILQLLDSQPRS